MTRTIKASEIKPGMEIEWKFGGYYTRCVVGLVQEENLSYPAYSIRAVGSAAGWKTFSPGREVTVLKEAQPEEPTTFGARVVVDGVQFVRRGRGSTCAWEASFGTCFTWDDLLCLGHVTVVPDQDDDNSDQWDDIETALKHCDRVIDKEGDQWYYLDGDLHFTFFGRSTSWELNIRGVNEYGPFRRT